MDAKTEGNIGRYFNVSNFIEHLVQQTVCEMKCKYKFSHKSILVTRI